MSDLIDKALVFAKQKHEGQLDDDGAPYFEVHLLPVANILQQITKDEVVIAVGLLHDTLEDTDTTVREILDAFGKDVANLVLEVTHEGFGDTNVHLFPRLRSKKAIMVKFADRLSNISRMKSWSEEHKELYLKHSIFWEDKALDDLPP